MLLKSVLRIFFVIFYITQLRCEDKKTNAQPKILTDDGHIKFQSAKNRNISFELEGADADVQFGDTSIKQIKNSLDSHSSDIKKLIQVGENRACAKSNPCGENGVCVDALTTNQNQDGYRCVCRGIYKGKHCEQTDPCLALTCANGGECQEIGGRAICVCSAQWFGATCSVPKPQECKFVVKEKTGFIASPGYPNGYPSNMDCTWDLETSPGMVMQLVLVVTGIGLSPQCTTDYLEIIDATTSQRITQVCGVVPPQSHFSFSSKVQIKFKSGQTPVGFGFSIFFQEIKNEQCGGLLETSTGRITSEGVKKQPCVWLIDTKSSEKLFLNLQTLNIVNDAGKCENYLEVRSGLTYDAPLVEKVCHSNSSMTIKTTSGKLFVKFVSKTEGNAMDAIYDAECGGIIDLSAGQTKYIHSPFYPNAYPSKRQCKWVFHADEFQRITVRFSDLAVEYHESCDFDRVTVETGESIRTFCGNEKPFAMTSHGNRMVVEFRTDGDGDFKGFKASVVAADQDCTASFYGSEGIIHSPQYPGLYDNRRDCLYTMVSEDSKSAVQITFNTFELEQSEHCEKDFIEVYDGDSTNSLKLLTEQFVGGRVCGGRRPPVITSSTRVLTVRFRSNENTTKNGFSASWKSIATTKDCDVTLEESTGSFSSPLYPSNYPTTSKCRTKITSPDGHNIQVSFNFFELELSTECSKDSVAIYDGPDERARLIGKFCGGDNPGRMVSSGNAMMVVFDSDKDFVDKGFYATYQTGTNLCGGTLQGPSGFIQSPGYPNSYQPLLECNWLIKASEGNTISLRILSFELEQSDNCLDDSLSIHDGRNNGGEVIETLCGTVAPKTFHSTGKFIFLKFRSNANVQWKGFSLQYTEDCSRDLTARDGVILSPNYPQNYPPNKQCTWNIKGNTNDVITINTMAFDMQKSDDCSADSLSINGRKFCGNTGPSVTLPTGSVVMTFKSDDVISESGFKLNYTIQGCSEDFFNDKGTFTSPNYPADYPNRAYCLWRIRVSAGMKVQLTFQDFALEGHCDRDSVTVYNGYLLTSPEVGTYCSTQQPFTLESSSNEMTVLFRSSFNRVRKGFKASYKAIKGGCGGRLTGVEGSLSSPAFPANYPPLSSCEWTIDVNSTQRVFMTISPLAFPGTDNNCSDYLTIADGVTYNEIGKFCGSTTTIVQLNVTGSKAVIKFVSDGDQVQGAGFKIDYKLVCGGEIEVSGDDVIFTSPHYPNYYKFDECEWLLRTTPGNKIHLRFVDFSVERCGSGSSCTCDYIQVHDGSDMNTGLLGRFCGNSIPASLFSSGNEMFVKMKTDQYFHQRGFKAILSTNTAACGGRLLGYEGAMVSPLYPRNTPQNADCVWSINTSEGSLVSFAFETDFESEACNNTYINLYDGPSTASPLIRKVCSLESTQSVRSSSNEMTVQFVTNEPHNGFSAKYTTGCLNVMQSKSSGYIESPGYPNFYPEDLQCQWLFDVPEGKTISFVFEEMDLEASTVECSDYVVIFNRETYKRATDNLCGRELPDSQLLNWRQPAVRFITDGFLQRHGFKLRYSIIEHVPICGGNLIATQQNQYITTPNFPQEYPNLKDCRWEITAERKDLRVSLQFVSFHLEASGTCNYDFIRITGGEEPITLCGFQSNVPSIQSEGEKLIVEFESDYGFARPGFNATFTSMCEQEMIATKGVIKSFIDPTTQEYSSNSDCHWLFKQQGGIVIVNFKSFDIELSTNCSKDYVVIQDGIQATSPVLGKFCGNELPDRVNSTGHELMVTFVSDGEKNGKGFEIEYERYIEGCGGKEVLTDAGVSYQLKSPDFPNNLPQNTECEWNLEVPNGYAIDFVFNSLNFSKTSCDETFLELTSGEKTVKYCDGEIKESSPVFKSSLNTMKVRLRTGQTGLDYNGFSATWRIGCGGIQRGRRGFIQSPGYPNGYAENLKCQWIVQVQPHYSVNIKKALVSLPPPTSFGCNKDVIFIRQGNSSSGELILQLCGNEEYSDYKTGYNQLLVGFESDSTNDGSEFKGAFSEYDTVCGEHIKKLDATKPLSGVVSLKPDGGYDSSDLCEWVIEFPAGKKISLNTKFFNLETGYPECNFDKLEIRDGKDNNAPLVGKFCGETKPPPVQSSENFLYIRFTSDAFRSGQGFELEYSEQTIACGGSLTIEESTILTSPNFPEDYGSNKDCGWQLKAAPGKHIEIVFNEILISESFFSSCYDYLLVYENGQPDEHYRRTRSICGTSPPSAITSISNSLYLLLHTIDKPFFFSGTRKFNITLNVVEKACGGEFKIGVNETKQLTLRNIQSNGSCEYLFKAPVGKHVSVTIKSMSLAPREQDGDCASNQVSLRDSYRSMDHIFCGEETTQFRGTWNSVFMTLKETQISNTLEIEYSTLENCDMKFTGNNGLVTSPNYPSTYPDHLNCRLSIQAPVDKVISLYPVAMDTESFTGRCIDKVDIYDGDNNEPQNRFSNDTYCGRVLSPSYTSSGTQMLITFTSDYGTSHSGFAFTYLIHPPQECGGEITGTEGALSTPSYPSYYTANLTCTWNIRVGEGKRIQINVLDFESETPSAGQDCSNVDYLQFTDQSTGQTMGQHCGTSEPAQRVTTSNTLQVKFLSNSEMNDFRGFRLTFKEI
ncbi:cubilin-like isoform X2 [Clytia hemisphaerica]|uniref:cubilin-like isoform X2 n=1 Tax=Clytia hemisphaerica TaxID=252671 RepID=UPI0034D4E567